MSEIDTIKSGLKTRIAAVLGSYYSELDYTNEVERNNFKGNAKRYGVLAGGLLENEARGCTGKYTVDQSYIVKLTDNFIPSVLDDDNRIASIDNLLNKSLALYKDFLNSQAGASSLVTLVSDLVIDEPELLDNNIVLITMNITITYRKALGA